MSEIEYWDGTGVEIQALKAEVIRLAEESPDTRRQCTYSANGEPVCIVGQAVFNITGKVVDNYVWFGQIYGDYQWINALGGDSYEHNNGMSAENYDAFCFVADVQKHQDKGNTWGEALIYAQER